jgi:nucleotide-binding universal stress UspA family protein
MRRIEKILCPLDSSEYSLKASEYALSWAQHDGAKLLLQQVVQPLTFTCPCYAFPDPIYEVFRNLETGVGHGRQGFSHFTRGPVAGKVLR